MYDDTMLRIMLSKKEHECEALRKDRNKWKELAEETREGNNNLLKEIRKLEKMLDLLGGND